MASKKSPLPKSSRLQRRFAVSIKSTARSGVRWIRVFSSNAPHLFRSRTGKRGRVCSRVVVEVLIRLRLLINILPGFAMAGYKTLGQCHAACSNCQAAKRRVEAGCASRAIAPSCEYENGKSHIRRGMLLGRGRNLPKIERRSLDSRWLRRRGKRESDLRRCLHGRDRPRRSGGNRIRSVATEIRRTTRCFLVEPQSNDLESARSGPRNAISLGDFLSFARAKDGSSRLQGKDGPERAFSPAGRNANRTGAQVLARGRLSSALSPEAWPGALRDLNPIAHESRSDSHKEFCRR